MKGKMVDAIKTLGQERGRLVRVLGTAPDSRGRGVRAPDDIALTDSFDRTQNGFK